MKIRRAADWLAPIGRWHRPTGVLQGVLVLAGGTIIGQLIGILALPMITRLYTPSDMGRYGLILSFLSFASTASTLKYEAGIITPRRDRTANRLAVAVLLINIPTALALSVLLLTLIVNRRFGFGSLSVSVVPWVGVGIAAITVFTTLRALALRRSRFAAVTRVTVYQNVVRSAVQLAAGFLHVGWIGLVSGEILGRVGGIGQLSRGMMQPLWRTLREARRGSLGRLLWAYRKLPILTLPSSLVDISVVTLLTPAIAQMYGTAPAGLFALAQRATAVPLVLIGQSFADAFHSRLAARVHSHPGETAKLFWDTARLIFAVSLIPVLVLGVAGPAMFAAVFGESWRGAGEIARAMAPALLVQLVVSPLSRSVLVLSGQEFKLFYDLASVALLVATLVLASRWNLPIIVTTWLFTAGRVVAYGVYLLALHRLVTRHDRNVRASLAIA